MVAMMPAGSTPMIPMMVAVVMSSLITVSREAAAASAEAAIGAPPVAGVRLQAGRRGRHPLHGVRTSGSGSLVTSGISGDGAPAAVVVLDAAGVAVRRGRGALVGGRQDEGRVGGFGYRHGLNVDAIFSTEDENMLLTTVTVNTMVSASALLSLIHLASSSEKSATSTMCSIVVSSRSFF